MVTSRCGGGACGGQFASQHTNTWRTRAERVHQAVCTQPTMVDSDDDRPLLRVIHPVQDAVHPPGPDVLSDDGQPTAPVPPTNRVLLVPESEDSTQAASTGVAQGIGYEGTPSMFVGEACQMRVDAGMSSQQRTVAPIMVHNRFAELAQEEIPEPGRTMIDDSEVPMTAVDSTFCPCVAPVIVQDHGVELPESPAPGNVMSTCWDRI